MKSQTVVRAILLMSLAMPLGTSPALSVDQTSTSPTVSQVEAAPDPVSAPVKSQGGTSEAPVESKTPRREDKVAIIIICGIFSAILGFIVLSSLKKNT